MKKIFTLISMAMVAMSMNAQTPEKWEAEQVTKTTVVEEKTVYSIDESKVVTTENPGTNYLVAGTYEKPIDPEPTYEQAKAVASAVKLYDYTIEFGTASIKWKAISTPNSNATTVNDAWSLQDKTGGNQALNTDDCLPPFNMYIQAKAGNPSIGDYIAYWFPGSNGPSLKLPQETYWTPGCGKLPTKGAYYEITPSVDGALRAAIFVNKNLANRPIYIVNKADLSVMAPADYNFEGFLNNNTWKGYPDGGEANVPYNKFNTTEDYLIVNLNQNFFGYLNVNLKANQTYLLLTPQGQIGLYGYYFVPSGGGSGIETVKAAQNVNAPMYNLAGQKVEKGFKGITIQNGKKIVVK